MAWYEKATDNFNRSENPLSTGWSNYLDTYLGLKATGANAIGTVNLTWNISIHTGTKFGPNQYVVTTVGGSTGYCGHVIRANGAGGSWANSSFYICWWNSGVGTVSFYKKSPTSVGYVKQAAPTGSVANGLFRSEMVGSVYTLYREGSQIFTATDTELKIGWPGIWHNDTPAYHDGFSAGDDGTGLVRPFPFPRLS